MKPIAPTDARWIHTLWIGLLMAVSAGLTTGYTCVVPFAALGVAAAMTLPRREALVCAMAVWLANQAAGFGLSLHSYWHTPRATITSGDQLDFLVATSRTAITNPRKKRSSWADQINE